MTWESSITITCNICGSELTATGFPSVHALRQQLVDRGYRVIEGNDYCETCEPYKESLGAWEGIPREKKEDDKDSEAKQGE